MRPGYPDVSAGMPSHTGVESLGDFGVYPNVLPHTDTPGGTEAPLRGTVEPDPAYGGWVDPAISPLVEEEMLHEQIHGVVLHGYDILVWVNPSNPGAPNRGPANVQAVQDGHTQNLLHNPAAEGQWGNDPAVRPAGYPKVEGTNPYYGTYIHRRNGTWDWSVPSLPFAHVTAHRYEALWDRRMASTTHERQTQPPTSVPYGSTLPTYGQAGPLPHAYWEEGIY